MDWINEAKRLFYAEKPEHFTDYNHCQECYEHDQTLRNADIDSIGMAELGNIGWYPLWFTDAEGVKYYMLALIRLALETIDDEFNFYFDQLLSHLEDELGEKLRLACNQEQRRFIHRFVEFVISQYPKQLAEQLCEDEAQKVAEIWGSE